MDARALRGPADIVVIALVVHERAERHDVRPALAAPAIAYVAVVALVIHEQADAAVGDEFLLPRRRAERQRPALAVSRHIAQRILGRVTGQPVLVVAFEVGQDSEPERRGRALPHRSAVVDVRARIVEEHPEAKHPRALAERVRAERVVAGLVPKHANPEDSRALTEVFRPVDVIARKVHEHPHAEEPEALHVA